MTTRAEPGRRPALASHRSLSDESLLHSFDPVIEGSSFEVIEEIRELEREGIDPSRHSSGSAAEEMPEAVEAFDLAEALAKIPNKLFFRIGDAAELLGLKPYVLRFWETEFPMVKPTKSRSGQRVYRKKDVEMLVLIKHLLYVERFSIEGARKKIRELKLKPAKAALEASRVSTAAASAATEMGIKSKSSVAAESAEKLREMIASARETASAELSAFFRF
jgi:DNA-binding transcriptional MerR regulator